MRSARRPAGLLLALGIVAAGCAADRPPEVRVTPADALTVADAEQYDLDGVPIAVGSREGAADEVLGWMAVELLVAAGAEVTQDLAIGDAPATREAQLAGLIDLTWERTGTGWLALLREIGPSADPNQLYQDVRDEDLDENGIVWLPPAPADTGLGIVAAAATVDELDIDAVSGLAAALEEGEEGVVVCVSRAEVPLDPAGLPALAEAADTPLRRRAFVGVPQDRLLALTEEGTFCPFALVARLDPGLTDAEVEFLADDLGAFVAQNPAVTIREDSFEPAPGVEDLVAPLSERIDTDTLRALAAQVTEEGASPRDVARDWLVEEELATGP